MNTGELAPWNHLNAFNHFLVKMTTEIVFKQSKTKNRPNQTKEKAV